MIACGGQTEYAREPQIAALGAVLPVGIDQTLGPPQPAARPGRLAEGHRAQRQPERRPRGRVLLAGVESELMQPLECFERRLITPRERR